MGNLFFQMAVGPGARVWQVRHPGVTGSGAWRFGQYRVTVYLNRALRVFRALKKGLKKSEKLTKQKYVFRYRDRCQGPTLS